MKHEMCDIVSTQHVGDTGLNPQCVQFDLIEQRMCDLET